MVPQVATLEGCSMSPAITDPSVSNVLSSPRTLDEIMTAAWMFLVSLPAPKVRWEVVTIENGVRDVKSCMCVTLCLHCNGGRTASMVPMAPRVFPPDQTVATEPF